MTKYLRIGSDFHLEQFVYTTEEELVNKFLPPDSRDKDSALVLAGDISSRPGQLLDFLEFLVHSNRFTKVLFVPGNHEFYEYSMKEWMSYIDTELGDLTNNGLNQITWTTSLDTVDEFRILLDPLWSDGGSPVNHGYLLQQVSDFRRIREDKELLDLERLKALNQAAKFFIDYALRYYHTQNKPTIVVSHHLPSHSLFDSSQRGQEIIGSFTSDCSDMMLSDHAPVLWIHGHTHKTIKTEIGHTQIRCNPAGYVRERQTRMNTFFDEPMFVDLNDFRKAQ